MKQQEKLERESELILKEYRRRGRKEGHRVLIEDGIANIGKYVGTWPKVLWILKEAYNEAEGGEAGGDWSMARVLNEGKYGDDWRSLRPIACVTHAVLSGFLKYKELPSLSSDEKIRKSTQGIAYINVSKFPGKSGSTYAPLKAVYEQYSDLLLRQIALFEPNVLIFGNTIDLFRSDLHLSKEYNKDEQRESARFKIKDDKLYIQAYHPSQRNTTDKVLYVNDLVAIIKKYCAKYAHSPHIG